MHGVGTQEVSKGMKRIFPKIYIGSHGKQRGGPEGGRNQRRVNSAPNQVLGGRIPRVNGQDQIVQTGNYCYSSFRVASMDKNKTQPQKDYPDSYSNHMSKLYRPSRW